MKTLMRYEVHMLCGGIAGTFTKYKRGQQLGCGDGRSLLKELCGFTPQDLEDYRLLFIFIGSNPSVSIRKLVDNLGPDVYTFVTKKEKMKKSNLREEYFLSQTFGTGYDRYSAVPSDFITDEKLPPLPPPRSYSAVELEKITGFYYEEMDSEALFEDLKKKLDIKTEKEFLKNWLRVKGTDLLSLYEAVLPGTRFLSDSCFISKEREPDKRGDYGTWSVLYFSAKHFIIMKGEKRFYSEKLLNVLKKSPAVFETVFENLQMEAAPSGSTFQDQVRTIIVSVMGERFLNVAHAPIKDYERLSLPGTGVIPVSLFQQDGHKVKVIGLSLEMAIFSQVTSEQILNGLIYFFTMNIENKN